MAKSARRLVLQPMAGAATLRRWLVEQGWSLVREALVEDEPHFYEIICAERGSGNSESGSVNTVGEGAVKEQTGPVSYSEAEYLVGPALLRDGHPLLEKQIERQQGSLQELLTNMARSERAKASAKFKEAQKLLQELEELKHSIK